MAEGSVSELEGECLRDLAAQVPKSAVIVELGSYRGQSTSWLAAGAASGNGARVITVDAYDSEDGPEDHEAFEAFIAASGWYVEQIVGDVAAVGNEWFGHIGLLFHDADHDIDVVQRDLWAWEQNVISGGWFAVHDYYGSIWAEGENKWMRTGFHQEAVDRVLLASGTWVDVQVVDNLWIGRRVVR
jgi:predicted O-methyltransferase YrrM